MTEKWLIAPGEERVIDIESVTRLKVGLVGGHGSAKRRQTVVAAATLVVIFRGWPNTLC